MTSRSRRGPSRPRGWTDKEDEGAEEEEEAGSENQSRRSLPPEAGVRPSYPLDWLQIIALVQFSNHIRFMCGGV